MSKFVKRDEVVLLRDLTSYRGPNIPVGTRGTIVTLDVDSSTVYYVNFDGYGVRRVREDSLSLLSKNDIGIIGDFYMKIKNEKYISSSSTIAPRTFNIASSIKDVIYNDPATIIFWKDGTKSVVKCDGEEYDPEKGFAMAVCKKAFGNEGNYYNTFKKWLPEEREFEVGEFVKLSKEIYGMSAGSWVYIADIDKEKKNSYIVRTNKGWTCTVDKKYLRRKTK